MSVSVAEESAFPTASAIAARFVEARRAGVRLPDYPGLIPPDLASAYACQEAAIGLWPEAIAGWKVGRVAPALETRYGASRLAGPIFTGAVLASTAEQSVAFPVFVGGFAAVEAEFVFRLAHDAPADKTDWSIEEALEIAGALHVGVETAGSPLATINDLGPTVVVSDFGNNAGLIVGGEIPDWRDRPLESLTCETFVDSRSVGAGGAANLPGGPLEALRFLLAKSALRGRPLKAGQWISTGATTGIHEIAAGQEARVDFGPFGEIRCHAVAASEAAPQDASPHVRNAFAH